MSSPRSCKPQQKQANQLSERTVHPSQLKSLEGQIQTMAILGCWLAINVLLVLGLVVSFIHYVVVVVCTTTEV